MGGGITLRAMVVSHNIKAGALLAGVVASPQSFYRYWQQKINDPSVPSWIKENGNRTLNEFGTPDANPELWNSISPYTYLDDITAPIQIHHGTADKDVPIVFSEELNNALEAVGKQVEYFVYQNGDHNLAGAARGPVLTRTFEFFKQILK
jgi:dipeptidyl aminopeptidase/acylaminoacyl peptidase